MSDDEIISVVQAHKEGKQIEVRPKAYVIGDKPEPWRPAEWYAWNFAGYDYRVKPEPRKPREWNIVLGKEDTVRWGFPYRAEFVGDLNSVRVREVIE